MWIYFCKQFELNKQISNKERLFLLWPLSTLGCFLYWINCMIRSHWKVWASWKWEWHDIGENITFVRRRYIFFMRRLPHMMTRHIQYRHLWLQQRIIKFERFDHLNNAVWHFWPCHVEIHLWKQWISEVSERTSLETSKELPTKISPGEITVVARCFSSLFLSMNTRLQLRNLVISQDII